MAQTIQINKQFKKALHLMEQTRRNVFVTGKAGTGKSTLLAYFREITQKNIVVLAPTGVAAVNVQGQTIHSFFRFKPDITVQKVLKKYRNQGRGGLYRKLDVIIIDEISMVRADLFDCVDVFMRLNGPQKGEPFGGVQMILIGDLYQLPPVVVGAERELFHTHYESPYFFDSKAFSDIDLEFVELEKIYRQTDEKFIRLLNAVCNKSITEGDIALLNSRMDPAFEPNRDDLFVYLTPTNKRADAINNARLSQLKTPLTTYEGIIEGEFDIWALPACMNLTLKKGAQIMLVNNDRRERWINGTIGTIINIKKGQGGDDDDSIVVELLDGERVQVVPHTWEMFRFYFNKTSGRIESETTGSYTQYPLILAWAVTIHKSQGKTFDNVIIDLDRGTFAHGQAYVALSRCRSLEGIVLTKPFEAKHILTDWRVMHFLTAFQYKQANMAFGVDEKVRLIQETIEKKESFKIVYLKTNDTKSRRMIKPIRVGEMEYQGKPFLGVEGYCYLRRDTRVFRVDRILEIDEEKPRVTTAQ